MLTHRQGLLLVLGAILAPGCIPDAVDVTGKRCGPEQSCGPGLQCVEGRCTSDDVQPPPTNLVRNPGFENGVEGWETTGELSTEAPGFAGALAARLVPTGNGEPVTLTPRSPPLLDAEDSYYCASAWVRGGAGHTAVLEILEGTEVSSSEELPLDGTWRQVKVSTLLFENEVGTLRLVIPAEVDTPVWVDEVALWRSDSVLCENGP
ncbi:hypothetical protein HPC49_03320 [Pyxidicoccus fallax]|uniref:Uncharacterized protein n=1 Tax=Pyxidicoccus fallax TaxID=394095 RepID=A0A848LA45_9BACT|nr:hypothetical protein [Pyxidicoccus fallax]NMO15749.1 hypothetical protein [Pyxidicoccus fallax]NPC77287.1 hypothetical protein [Pyxidicoccus fallax]